MSLGSFFGSFGRRDEPVSPAAMSPTADLPTADEDLAAAADEPAAASEPASEPLPAAPAVAEDPAHRIASLEEQLRSTLERLGRRTTEVRNLEARMKVMDPLVEQVRQRDQWLDEARKEARKALADRDAEADRRRSLEGDLALLRKEVDWRDYVIRDLERMPDQLRDRENLLVRLRKDHAAAIAEREAEISRLRTRLDDLQRVGAA